MNLKGIKLKDLRWHLSKPVIGRKGNLITIRCYDEDEAIEVMEELING